ncbi:condensation domain-containing protein [Streptacidiphilus sp. P02-A3a]|uniref:condensation domain-containing protein n=1 Tax=Streptacidiphilus sp. P02-A3a TaxID=2704468 RepID=UPI0015FBE749|nr:condensation domain-containing protein [Streptacidiphilus sp. P02-A3a]QMU70187.1 hypothetical protein GXP74_20115 [Streptacidiphilus sp. P02-A3a]
MDIAPDLSARLTEAAKRTKLTTSTLLQGAWALLLARYSGSPDVCFGGTVSGRTPDLAGVDSIIGMLVNTLPVHVRVDRAQDLETWLADLQARQARARDFEAVSLTPGPGLERPVAGDNLFDSIIVFENFPFDEHAFTAHGLRLSHFDHEVGSGAALGVVVHPGDGITMRVHYDPALFEADTVHRMTGLPADPAGGLRRPHRTHRRRPAGPLDRRTPGGHGRPGRHRHRPPGRAPDAGPGHRTGTAAPAGGRGGTRTTSG